MDSDSDKKREAFELLDEIGDLKHEDIEKYFKEDVFVLVGILLSELTEDEVLPAPITPSIFVNLIRKLHKIKKLWGRRLGDSLIASADKADIGDSEAAITLLNEFISNCPSRFFKEYAQNEINYYKKKKEERSKGA